MVQAVPSGEVELRWAPPTERTTGAALQRSELAGYRVYYGPDPETEWGVIEINDPQQTTVLITGLEPGSDYYFAVTALDQAGRESPKSSRIRATAKP